MLGDLKNFFYFPLSYYFRFFAKIRLAIWKPYIIVVTGSSGKTSLLHLLESQIGEKAKYSHLANSTYGIPFDILGLKRSTLAPQEWLKIIFLTPFSILKRSPKEKIYVAEADSDRPGEGQFLASLLKPNVTVWIGTGKTHTGNFDKEVEKGKFKTVEDAVASEFAHFLAYSKDFSIVNGDSQAIGKHLRKKFQIEKVYLKSLRKYEVGEEGTIFKNGKEIFKFSEILPKEFYYSIRAALILLRKMGLKPDLSFKNFNLPKGRSNLFRGIKKTTLIDSTYNATPDGMEAALSMYSSYPSDNKWLVLGDMIELGSIEGREHEDLRDKIINSGAKRIILLKKYTLPKFGPNGSIKSFISPKEALNYLWANLKGGETILFKGARFLEGIIENLLEDKKDAEKLVRRERVWAKRRQKFGL
jgi:UDP-N-acetylmuramoyl-tripeptide--D-alanyl-D-alanine ligase